MHGLAQVAILNKDVRVVVELFCKLYVLACKMMDSVELQFFILHFLRTASFSASEWSFILLIKTRMIAAIETTDTYCRLIQQDIA